MPSRTPARFIIAAVFFGASGSAIRLIALGAWMATRLGVSDGLVASRRELQGINLAGAGATGE